MTTTHFRPAPTTLAWSRLPEVAILLLAALTRFWRLDYHSFWFDETVSLRWAATAPEYTWDVTLQLVQEKHPPVYYLLLHYWRALLAPSGLAHDDFALRSLGALLGVLTVAGLLLLARRLSGRATALLAGAFVALSPALTWYSQELRMFQPATTAITWAAWCMLAAWQARRGWVRLGWWLGMVAAFSAALYSYLFSAFVLPAAGIALLVLALASRPIAWRRLLEGVVALGLTGLLFLPLARNAWLANASDGTPGQAFMDFLPTLVRQLQIFTVWRVDWPAPALTAALLLWGILVLAGLLLPRRTVHGDRTPAHALDRPWLWAWIGVPLLVGNLLLARNDTIFAEDRYFLFLGPFVLWAAARGVVVAAGWLVPGRGRWTLTAATGLAALLLLALALPRLWSPAMLREEWRAAAAYVADAQAASPGLRAAAVAHVDYTRNALNWYLRQRYTQEQLPVYFPFGGTLAPDQVDTLVAPPLLGIEAEGFDTLWMLQSHLEGVDEGRLVEGWLTQRYPTLTEQYPTGIKLTGYALRSQYDSLPTLAPNAVFPNAEVVPGLILAACEIVTPQVSASDERMHPPSGWVHVRLWWQATTPLDQDFMPTVQMIGPEGVWGDRLYRDNEPLRRLPTSSWTPGVYVRDEVDVNLNPVTPAGEYAIVVGLRDGAGGEVGEKVACGRVGVGVAGGQGDWETR